MNTAIVITVTDTDTGTVSTMPAYVIDDDALAFLEAITYNNGDSDHLTPNTY